MKIRYKIWIEKDGKVLFGRGRDDILRAVEKGQSLNAAAKQLEMSYRAAWGRLKASEERMGVKLVEAGIGHRSIQLTAQAKAILVRFEQLERDVQNLLAEAEHEFRRMIRKEGCSLN
jgi:molybdate transport system regulatory protein